MTEGMRDPSLTERIVSAWGDLRGSMRALLAAGPSEGFLLFLAMLSGLILLLGNLAVLWLGPAGAMAPDAIVMRVGAEVVGALFYRTLGLYLVAGLGWALARAFGGVGSGRDSRAALFWAALVAAPVGFGAGLAEAVLAPVAPLWLAETAGQAGMLAFALATAHCMAEAHGFKSAWAVFAVIAAVLLTIALLLVMVAG